MKKFIPFYIIFLFLFSLLMLMGSHSSTVSAQVAPTPTPTYDPLAEPFLPENPSEYELGRNWYWLHCMPCHGDKGQGLTDEWRAAWVPDHQDCWGRGCHAGERIEDSFTIPTVVPPVTSSSKLARFSSIQVLYEYLKATHPPQYPGHLDDEQYHAIALFVFSMNDRPVDEFTPVPTMTPAPTTTSTPEIISAEETVSQPNLIIYIGLGIISIVAAMWGIQMFRRLKKGDGD